MSATFKGRAGLTVVSEEPTWDAETGIGQYELTVAGSKRAIFGYARELELEGISYRMSNSGPLYTLTTRVPTLLSTEIGELDRWEISTESQDKSIFEHPIIIQDAATYDAQLTAGQRTYRQWALDAVDGKVTADVAGAWPYQESVIRHLKNGATGYQVDFIVLRRTRKVDITTANTIGKMNLSDGSYIYSTAQLQLPADVAFSLPSTPTAPSVDYAWGWKRRGQRAEIVGMFVEQTIELVFAPWSTLLYSNSASNFNW
jgi:hypothetical protein